MQRLVTPASPFADAARLEEDVEKYSSLGPHRSGTAGNRQATDWMASRLAGAGFEVERQGFMIPHFEPGAVAVHLPGGDKIEAFPQWPLPAESLSLEAPAELYVHGGANAGLEGALAVIDLPYARWSSFQQKPVRERVQTAAEAGAKAAILIPNGPTGEIIALNALPEGRLPVPVVIVAPKTAAPILRAAQGGTRLRLDLAFKGPMKGFAENVLARRNAGVPGKWIVVTTPLSGWFTCASERGPGIAIFLALADWLAQAAPEARLLFTANSGHELENLGADMLLKEVAPKPEDVALWVHLGAGIASRDLHEGLGTLLPSADAQRFLMASPALLDVARAAFAGQPGLEAPYPADERAQGELKHFIEAGYQPIIGGLGATRWHHTRIDTPDKTSGALIAEAAEGFRKVIAHALQQM